jgi:hypothetical protein
MLQIAEPQLFWILVGKSTMLEGLKDDNGAFSFFYYYQIGNLRYVKLIWYCTRILKWALIPSGKKKIYEEALYKWTKYRYYHVEMEV